MPETPLGPLVESELREISVKLRAISPFIKCTVFFIAAGAREAFKFRFEKRLMFQIEFSLDSSSL